MRGMMGRLSTLLIIPVMLSVIKMDALVFTENYVTPNKSIGCSASQSQNCCLPLQEYASQPDVYFKNDTILYFEPGEHLLKNTLKLESLTNVTLQGSSSSSTALKVIVSFDMFASITWEKCWNITISSIIFALIDNFTFSIVFNQARTTDKTVMLFWQKKYVILMHFIWHILLCYSDIHR